MPKIVTFFEGVIRRVKKVEEQIYLVAGVALFSVGVIYEVEHPTTFAVWITLIVFGMGFWLAAALRASKKERAEQAKWRAKMVS
jgi:hypothetical membrane protein